jgi:hypothetical protein
LPKRLHPAFSAVQRSHQRALKLRCLAAAKFSDERRDFTSELAHLPGDFRGIVEASLADEVGDDQTVLFELLDQRAVHSLTGARRLVASIRGLLTLMEAFQTLLHVQQEGNGSRAAMITHVEQLGGDPAIRAHHRIATASRFLEIIRQRFFETNGEGRQQ